MAVKKEDKALGAEFENTVKDILKELQAKHPLFWHPFADSKAAGRLIAAQPSDFLVGTAIAGMTLLEVKASCEKPSLTKCYKSHIRPSQVGMAKKWIRAGHPSLFLFYCEIDATVELWDGQYVTDCISDEVKMTDGAKHYGLIAKGSYLDLDKILFSHYLEQH